MIERIIQVNGDLYIPFAVSVSIVIFILIGPMAYVAWRFFRPQVSEPADPIKIESGDFTWAVSVEGRRQHWKLAYRSADDFPFDKSYRGEIEYSGYIYNITFFTETLISVEGPFVLEEKDETRE